MNIKRTLSLLFCLLTSSISYGQTPAKTVNNPFDVLPFALPKTDIALTKDYRKNWVRLTGFEYSGLHWRQFVAIFVNKGADIYRDNYLAYLALYRDDDDDEDEGEEESEGVFQAYPVGTIFLKENYQSSSGKPGDPTTLTLMVKKQKGYDSSGGDWQYLQSDVNGNILLEGDSRDPAIKAACSDCHSNMAERDYVFSTFLTNKPGH